MVTLFGTTQEDETLMATMRLRDGGVSLFWRVCLTNSIVFAIGTTVLAVSPATVSSPVVLTEAVVLTIGIGLILALNAALLRSTLAPLDRLVRLMASIDLLRPGQRLPESSNGAVSQLVVAFNAMVSRLESERSASSARALAAQEAERRRIAQELHDEVGQSLTAVVLQLKRAADLAPAELRPELDSARETARASLDEVRRVARRLRPGVLDDLGLVSALSAMAGDLEAVSDTVVRRSFGPDLPALTPEVELVVFRVAQECLTNVARHSSAANAGISLAVDDGNLVLRVEDDGIGVGAAPEGAGIRGMRERALLVGADLDVGGGPHGTVVRLVVPRAAVAG